MIWSHYRLRYYTGVGDALTEYDRLAEDYPEDATGYVYYLDDYIGNDDDGTDTLMEYHYYATKEDALKDLADWDFYYDWGDDTQTYYSATVYQVPVNGDDMFETAERRMTVENSVGSVLEYSDEEVYKAMGSIGYSTRYASPKDLQKLTAIVMQLNDWQRKAVTAMNSERDYDLTEEANIMLQADEIPFYEFADPNWFLNDDARIGYCMFDNGLGPAVLQAAYDGPHRNYVDVEAYGRDLRLEGAVTITAYGFLFTADDTPDTDRYSEAEIDEWIKENA